MGLYEQLNQSATQHRGSLDTGLPTKLIAQAPAHNFIS